MMCVSLYLLKMYLEVALQLSHCYRRTSEAVWIKSIFDTFCKRSLNFVWQCLNYENVLVKFVSRHAAFYSRMCSDMGRNVQFYCERFGANLHVALTKERKLNDDKEMVWRACMINELVMFRDGVCCLSSDEFVQDDVSELISYLSVE